MIEYSVLITLVAACLMVIMTAITLWSEGRWENAGHALVDSPIAPTAATGGEVGEGENPGPEPGKHGKGSGGGGNGQGNNGNGNGNGGPSGYCCGGLRNGQANTGK